MDSVVIERMGPLGDGVATQPGGDLYVPFTLPGEEVIAVREAKQAILTHVVRPSPDRTAPICRHFGDCGGCKLQHWRHEPYLAWKRELVRAALTAQDIAAEVAETLDAHGDGRRRVTLHARRAGNAVHSGFMRASSHAIVDIEACPILVPALAGAPLIGAAIAALVTQGGKPADIAMTATEAGIDVTVRGSGPLRQAERQALIGLAERSDLARLSNHHEVVVERRPPFLAIGSCRVTPPPGAFLQATARGEEMLAQLVAEALLPARHIADLFCGVGPFALRLAASARVSAFDADAGAVAALTRAVRSASRLKPVGSEVRDLFRRPLLAAELKAYDGLVLDPPRQGAEPQARELARSALRRIAYVSCSPATFARDAAILIAGGFTLAGVTPVDQFRFSPHLELVGVFTR